MPWADSCKPGYWWLFGTLRWGCLGWGWSKDPPNSVCLSVSLLLSLATSFSLCVCLSLPLSFQRTCSPSWTSSATSPRANFFPTQSLSFPIWTLRVDGGGRLGFSSLQGPSKVCHAVWGLPWAHPLAPLPWASLCSLGLSTGGPARGVPPPHIPKSRLPRFPSHSRLHFLLCLWEPVGVLWALAYPL